MHIFDVIALFIFLSGLFILINTYYLKQPSPIGLMLLALLLSLLVLVVGNLRPDLHIAEHVREYNFKEVLNQFVISVILFAGALNMDFRRLSQYKKPVLILSGTGVILSTFIIGTLVYFTLGLLGIELGYLYSLVFGALISSTDPISALSTVRRFHLPRSLEIKIAGESLFNGAFAVVLAFLLYHIAEISQVGEITALGVFKITLLEIGGGVSIGLLMGYIGYRLLKYVDNDSVEVEVLITMAMVMVGSFISEYIQVYSKMVAVVMGLMIGNLGRSKKGESAVGLYVYKFWNLLEETMAVMLFVLIGFEMLVIPLRLDYFAAGFIAVNIVLFGRWLSIFIPIKLMSHSRSFHNNTIPVLTWGALKGGLPIAISLALSDFPGKDLIITMTYVVVVCSVLYQGLSLPVLMREKYMLKRYQE